MRQKTALDTRHVVFALAIGFINVKNPMANDSRHICYESLQKFAVKQETKQHLFHYT